MGSARGRCDNKSGLLVVLVSWQVPPLQRHWPHSGPPKTEGHRQEPSCGCGMPCLQIRVVFFEKTGKLWMGERTRRRATRVMTWTFIMGRVESPRTGITVFQLKAPGPGEKAPGINVELIQKYVANDLTSPKQCAARAFLPYCHTANYNYFSEFWINLSWVVF